MINGVKRQDVAGAVRTSRLPGTAYRIALGLRPLLGASLPPSSRVAVTHALGPIDGLRDVVERILRSPDVRSCAVHCERSVRIRCATRHADRAHVLIDPGARQLTLRASADAGDRDMREQVIDVISREPLTGNRLSR